MTEHCPKCKAPDCERWAIEQKLAVAPMLVVQKWWMDKWNEDCAFRANACPECKGKCCRDTDYGCRVYHMGAEVYDHWCDYCHDGQVPKPDPRDEKIAELSAAIAAWPEATHNSGCAPMWDGGPCDCGTAALNARRKEARRVAGLEAEP
jgi:hypothetical protein